MIKPLLVRSERSVKSERLFISEIREIRDVIQYWQKELHILFCSISPTNLGPFSKPGIDLKSASLTFSKRPLHIQFHQVLDEILKVKDT